MNGSGPFDARDGEDLRRRGISVKEAGRQLTILARPRRFPVLDRPCTVEDGIEALDEAACDEAVEAHHRAAAVGRFRKFVPASGAATRMFRHLIPFQGAEGPLPADAPDAVREFLQNLPRFAFHELLLQVLGRQGRDPDSLDPVAHPGVYLAALLDPRGLGYASVPKGLLPFHRYPEEVRTAFEEHLVEAEGYVRDAGGTCRLHFTVSPIHLDHFRSALVEAAARLNTRLDARADVGFSVQKPSTDTLALDEAGRPFRDREGRLLFRPGGHGALIENLSDLGGDLVFIKNVDNVAHDRLKPQTVRWKQVLGGTLVLLEEQVRRHLAVLRGPSAGEREIERAARFARERLYLYLPAGTPVLKSRLVELLDRPLRVCGVVRNTGEPGGGPFWVREADGGSSLQIIESAQVDPASPEQRAVFGRSTHFNPVDLACALRNPDGKPYDLTRFVDPEAVLVTRKSHQGRDLLALERPGLWNGAMARWNTVFIEVPLDTFTPVKTVNDLLRPEHQPA